MAKARGGFARCRDRLARQPAIFGMGDNGQAKPRRIRQDAQHDAGIRDPLPPGADRLCACRLHKADFGEFRAFKATRSGSDRMNPEVGLACTGRLPNQGGVVQQRGLVRHQRGARDSAEMKGRFVGGKYAQVDETGGNDQSACVDRVGVFGDGYVARRNDPGACDQQRARHGCIACGIGQFAVYDG